MVQPLARLAGAGEGEGVCLVRTGSLLWLHYRLQGYSTGSARTRTRTFLHTYLVLPVVQTV
jgi:hypothetical protein